MQITRCNVYRAIKTVVVLESRNEYQYDESASHRVDLIGFKKKKKKKKGKKREEKV